MDSDIENYNTLEDRYCKLINDVQENKELLSAIWNDNIRAFRLYKNILIRI